jgi:hypothetical protein
MSEESMPVLSGAVLSFEMFMASWEELTAKNKHMQHLVEAGLEAANKFYLQMDHTSSYVVTMHMWTQSNIYCSQLMIVYASS